MLLVCPVLFQGGGGGGVVGGGGGRGGGYDFEKENDDTN